MSTSAGLASAKPATTSAAQLGVILPPPSSSNRSHTKSHTSTQQSKHKSKPKHTHTPIPSSLLAPLSSNASDRQNSKVNVKMTASANPKKPLPKIPPSSISQPLPPLLTHDISIPDDDEDDVAPSAPPHSTRSWCCCCGSSVSVAMIRPNNRRRTRAVDRTNAASNIEHTNESESTDSEVLCNVRIPLLLFLLLAIIASCTFLDVSSLPPSDHNDLMSFLSGAMKRTEHHTMAKAPISPQHLYHIRHSPDESKDSLIASDRPRPNAADPHSNALISLGPQVPDSAFLSPPYLTLATTPTGAPGVGLHVPCQWLEERFGKPQQFAELKTIIDFVRAGVEPPPAPVAPATEVPRPSLNSSSNANVTLEVQPFVATESVEVNRLLGSVGIYCQPEVVRDECEFEGVSKHSQSRLGTHSAIEISRLHSWFSGLPEIATYEEAPRTSDSTSTPGSVSFNKFTGAVATVNCRNQIRYAFPFARDEVPSVYIEPNFNTLPPNYAQFVSDRCTKEAKEAATKAKAAFAEKATANHAKQSHHTSIVEKAINQTINQTVDSQAAVPESPKRAKWVEPLIPLLPPVCSIASFSRPSLARACMRNARVIGFGDSTTQELLLMLIDFLEQDDGEDPADLTRMRVDITAGGRARSAQHASEWMPPNAGSNGEHRYVLIEHWAPQDSCYDNARTTFMGRLFSTARFPTPYLAAYNITVTLRWNVGVESCSAAKGPNRASDVDMYRASYRWLIESCLPDNAVEIANKYRKKPDGTWRTTAEYVEHVNQLFHNRARDNQIAYAEEAPPSGCKYPYLPLEESDALSLPEWQLHLASVPNFDFAVMGMGAHMAGFWNKPDAQKGQDGYSYNPEQFHHAFESHLVLVQSFARNVIIRETAWRTDPHGGSDIPLMNAVIREVTIEAQARALRQDMQDAQLMSIARRATIGGNLVGLTLAPPRRSVNWLPTFFNTAMLQKEDADHCSYKSVGGGFGDKGMRTPFCYPIVQKMIEIFCTNK